MKSVKDQTPASEMTLDVVELDEVMMDIVVGGLSSSDGAVNDAGCTNSSRCEHTSNGGGCSNGTDCLVGSPGGSSF